MLNVVWNSTCNVAQDKFCVVPEPVSYCSLDPDSWALVTMSAGKSKSELKAKGSQPSVLETEGHQNQTAQIFLSGTKTREERRKENEKSIFFISCYDFGSC